MSTTLKRRARSKYQHALISVHQHNHEFNMKAGAMLPFLLGVQVCLHQCAHFVPTSRLVRGYTYVNGVGESSKRNKCMLI